MKVMEKSDEKKRLKKALLLSAAVTAVLSLFALFILSAAADPPSYSEKEAENIIRMLDGSSCSLKKEEKAAFESFFSIRDINTISFERDNELSMLLLASDGRSLYTIPFSYQDGSIRCTMGVQLLITEDAILFFSKEGDILELNE